LNSFSLSLIDDRYQKELLYASLTSSGINWGERPSKKNKVFKAFPAHKIVKIEEAYQQYLMHQNSETPHSNDTPLYNTYKINEDGDEADFGQMVMYVKKSQVDLERHFAPSVYVSFFSSPIITTLHLIVNKLQVSILKF
jgi:hypothetical protein